MKALMISAPNSNSGKTLVSAGLLYALRKSGLNICGVKTGPDQVDRKILEYASDKPAGNVDSFLMTETGVKIALGLMKSNYAVIEGVMGLFDGIGIDEKNSSYEMAKNLDINIILVYAPTGEMFSMIPKLKGFLDFSQNRIKGIILNKVSASLYPTYKKMIEENLPLSVLGFFPKVESLDICESDLGLDLNSDTINDNFLNELNKNICENIDIKKIISLFQNIKTETFPNLKPTKVKTVIAMDDAINLYYSENISVLEKYSSVKYFSPIADVELPNCDFLYFGSGQIKSFAKALSKNESMRKSVKAFADKGGYILAEGESLCYLFESFDGFKMCGVFLGETESTLKLHNFGYKIIEFASDTILGKKGNQLYAAEYHKSKAPSPAIPAFKIIKASTQKTYKDGYYYKNTLGFFQNINFISCIENIYNLLCKIEKTLCLDD